MVAAKAGIGVIVFNAARFLRRGESLLMAISGPFTG